MKPFHVWRRPLGEACRIRVAGLENGRWLLTRLMGLSGAENSQPVCLSAVFGLSTFLVAYSPAMTRSKLRDLLAAIPEVELICQAA